MLPAPTMPMPTCFALHTLRSTGWRALRLLLPLLAALAGTWMPPPVLAARAPTEAAMAVPPWWNAYDDPQLRELLARSTARPGVLLRGYVEWRVSALRADIAGRLHGVAAQRLAAVQAEGGDADARRRALAEAETRVRHYALVHRSAEADLAQRLATLAVLSGRDEAALRQQLAGHGGMPQVQATLPAAEPRPQRHEDPGSLDREWARQALLDAAARAQRSQALLQAAQLQRDATQLRQGAQATGDDTMADAITQWLLQAARVVDDAGSLALAWSDWLQAGGTVAVAASAHAP